MNPISNIHIWNHFSETLLLRCHKGGLKDTVIPILLFPRATSKIDDVKFRRRLPNSSSGGHDDGGDDVFGGTTSFLSSKILFFHLSLDFLNLNVFSSNLCFMKMRYFRIKNLKILRNKVYYFLKHREIP